MTFHPGGYYRGSLDRYLGRRNKFSIWRLPLGKRKIGLAFMRDEQDLLTQEGFTLLEILVSISIMAIVMVLVYGSFSSSFTISERISEEREFFRSARLTMSKVVSEIEAAFWREEVGETVFNGSHSVVDGYPQGLFQSQLLWEEPFDGLHPSGPAIPCHRSSEIEAP